MNWRRLHLLYPVVLGLHNAEEYCRFDEFAGIYMEHLPERLKTRAVIRNAAVLMTCAAAALSFGASTGKSRALAGMLKTAILASAVNAVGHGFLSIRYKRWVPGTASALMLILPYALAVVAMLRIRRENSVASLLRLTLAGALAIPAASVFFLTAGYGMSQLNQARPVR